MENAKTIARLNRLKRLERLAQQRVHQHRLWLHERQEELDAATHEHGALRSYRDSYRTGGPPESVGGERKPVAVVSLALLAHRQRFVARLCSEIDQLSERAHARAMAFDAQREQLDEAHSMSIALSRLCERQIGSLACAATRDEQRRLDEVGQIQHGRAVHAFNLEESKHV